MSKVKQDQIINGMLALKSALRRERRLKLSMWTVLCFLSFSSLISGFYTQTTWRTLLIILGLSCALIAIKFGMDIFRLWRIEHNPLFFILHHKPKNIVWVYHVQRNQMPFGFQFSSSTMLCVHLLNNQEIQIHDTAARIDCILIALKILLPHASFGYSKAKAQLYSISPDLLRKEE